MQSALRASKQRHRDRVGRKNRQENNPRNRAALMEALYDENNAGNNTQV